MTKGISVPIEQDNSNSWFGMTEDQADTISSVVSGVVVGFACLGAAANAFLAIPSLIALISFEISSTVENTGYSLSVISGITYAKAQFWDTTKGKIKQWLLGHEYENQMEEEKIKASIDKHLNHINKYLEHIKEYQNSTDEEKSDTKKVLECLINALYDLNAKHLFENNQQEFSGKLYFISEQINLPESLVKFYFAEYPDKPVIQTEDDMLSWIMHLIKKFLLWVNWFLALSVVLAGSGIAVILTTLGSKNAILVIFSEIIGAGNLAGTLLWGPACFIALFGQACKLFINYTKQMAEFDWSGYSTKDLDHDIKYLVEKSKTLHEHYLELQQINSKQKISVLEKRISELEYEKGQLQRDNQQLQDMLLNLKPRMVTLQSTPTNENQPSPTKRPSMLRPDSRPRLEDEFIKKAEENAPFLAEQLRLLSATTGSKKYEVTDSKKLK